MMKKITLLLLVCAAILAGCGKKTASPAVPPMSAGSPETVSQVKQQPVEQPQATANSSAAKYYVDTKNFLIHPVDHSAPEKIVLLTFDDGPKGDSTVKLLDILDRYNAKAIWFISGFNYGPGYLPDPNKAGRFEDLVREIRKRGHIVANHTWMHKNLKELPAETQRKEISAMNDLLARITGEKPKFIRPPFGSNTEVLSEETKKQEMQWMNWSVGSLDWEYTDPQKVIRQTVSSVYSGANILMHDNDVEAQALDGILKQLSEQGYKFVLPTEVKRD